MKMRFLNKAGAAVFAVLVVFAFTACGGGDGSAGSADVSDATDSSGVATDSVVSEDAPSSADAVGASDSTQAAELAGATVIESGDELLIQTADISETATFYPVVVEGTLMEVFAVTAPDGTIRTAFNTCQVCWNSGRGYYIQEGDVFVCQNCGSQFSTSDVELVHGGCNPAPITADNKTEADGVIAIGYDVLAANAQYFANWKTGV